MQFNSVSDFINMGGYGFYVWLSFGAAAVILSLLLIYSIQGHGKIIKQIAKRMVREDKLREARQFLKQHHKQNNEKINEDKESVLNGVTE